MLRKRIFLYLALAIYQTLSFVFTIMVDGRLDLLGLLKYIPYFKYVAFIGLVLVIVDIVWFWREHMDSTFHRDRLENQNTYLKAKLYDQQEEANKKETNQKS
jgi:hypothetical protein